MVTTHDGAGSGSEPPDELLWSIKTIVLKTGLSRPSIYRRASAVQAIKPTPHPDVGLRRSRPVRR